MKLLKFSKGLGAEGREGSQEWYRFRYTVASQGVDYVTIRIQDGLLDGQEFRLQFVDGGRGLRRWCQYGPDVELDEKFDKVASSDIRD